MFRECEGKKRFPRVYEPKSLQYYGLVLDFIFSEFSEDCFFKYFITKKAHSLRRFQTDPATNDFATFVAISIEISISNYRPRLKCDSRCILDQVTNLSVGQLS